MNDFTTDEKVLDHVLLFDISCQIWSARKKLQPSDLPGVTELPPEEVISLGSKRICDPKQIQGFNTLKGRAHRACDKVGTRFLGGYAVPKEHAQALAADLMAIKRDFLRCRKDFLDGYEASVEAWIEANPAWAAALREATTPKAVVERGLAFGFSVTRVAKADDDETSALNEGLHDEVHSLSGRLFYEISRDAKELWEESILPRQGQSTITQRAIGALWKLQQKLRGFTFLDTKIGRVASHFEDVLNRMPKTGPVQGRDYTELFGLVVILSDEQKLKQFAAGYAAVQQSYAEAEGYERGQDVSDACTGLHITDEADAGAVPSGEAIDFSEFSDLIERPIDAHQDADNSLAEDDMTPSNAALESDAGLDDLQEGLVGYSDDEPTRPVPVIPSLQRGQALNF